MLGMDKTGKTAVLACHMGKTNASKEAEGRSDEPGPCLLMELL
jgi:hypothetical protein